jgi:hypothetical protein
MSIDVVVLVRVAVEQIQRQYSYIGDSEAIGWGSLNGRGVGWGTDFVAVLTHLGPGVTLGDVLTDVEEGLPGILDGAGQHDVAVTLEGLEPSGRAFDSVLSETGTAEVHGAERQLSVWQVLYGTPPPNSRLEAAKQLFGGEPNSSGDGETEHAIEAAAQAFLEGASSDRIRAAMRRLRDE